MAITSGRDKVFKLIARGTELDLFQDETIFLSNNVTGLFDIGKLPSDFTRQITLPGTKKNNEFFQHVYDISIDEPYLFKTNEKVIAQFDFDGFYVSQGYMQLEKVNLKENKYIESYEVSVFGLLSSFKRDLQSLTLNEVGEFDKYNHMFSMGCILNSLSGSSYGGQPNPSFANSIFTSSVDGHNLGGEIVYCLTDSGKQLAYQSVLGNNIRGINFARQTGNGFDGGDVVPQDFKPAMRLDKVIDAIFDETEYTYESTFLSESRFDNTYILLDRGLKYPIIDGVDLETYGQIEVGPISGSGVENTLSAGVTSSLLFTNVYDDPSFSISDANGTYTPFFGTAAVGTSVADMEITLNFKITGSSGPSSAPELTLYMQNNAGGQPSIYPLKYINDYIKRDYVNSGGDREYTLTQDVYSPGVTDVIVYNGRSYTFKIGYTGTGTVVIGPGGNEESRIKVKSLKQLGELSTINISDNMPFGTNGITLLDFLTSVQKKFNLQIYPSKTKPRHFIIETFNNWYKQGNVKNFDSYMDLNRTISVTPANNLGVREVEFGDTLDLDFLAQNFNKENNREFGKSYFRDTQNFFSQGKFEVTTGFGVSPLRYVAGSGLEGQAVTRLTTFQGAASNGILSLCSLSTSTYYHDGAGLEPDVGDTVYTDVNGNNPLTGFTYFINDSSPDYYEIGANGTLLSEEGSCAGGGGPTS